MPAYLITGGEGFIGSRIACATKGVSYDIRSGLDISDSRQIAAAAHGKDGIFHCAALISVPESMRQPDQYHQTNVAGTRSVIAAAERAGAKIVFSSSAAVYGDTIDSITELAALNPKSPYAENKREGESLLERSALPHIALRYFNAYGPGQSPQYAGVITAFITSALHGEDLVIYGDGNSIRDFVFIGDIVRANIAAMAHDNGSFQIFNIGSGVGTSIQELAKMIIRLTRSQSKIIHKTARPGDILHSRAIVAKARDILGWQAQVPLEEGLKETISYYQTAR